MSNSNKKSLRYGLATHSAAVFVHCFCLAAVGNAASVSTGSNAPPLCRILAVMETALQRVESESELGSHLKHGHQRLSDLVSQEGSQGDLGAVAVPRHPRHEGRFDLHGTKEGNEVGAQQDGKG
jgi:hypothetical protein